MKKKNQQPGPLHLRRQAEGILKGAQQHPAHDRTSIESKRLLHELEVHQVELELQNEQLLQTQNDLQAALDRLSDFFEFAPVGYLILDRNGVIRAANFAACTLLEVDRSLLVGRNFNFPPPDSRNHFTKFLGQVFGGAGEHETEIRLTTSGGRERYVRLKASAVPEGEECRVAIIDLTDLQQLQLFRVQVECLAEYAVYLLDPTGIILNWNAGAERLEGYRAEEIVGKHVSCLYEEGDRRAGKPKAELDQATAFGRFASECWRIRKDGSGFWADVVLTALRDESGNLWGFSKMTHDITERKRAQERLRKSEEKFSRIFQTAPVLLTISTIPEGVCVEINDRGLEALGYRREEVLGASFLELGVWESLSERERMWRTMEAKGSVEDLEFNFRRKDGTLISCMFSGEIIQLEEKEYLLSLVKDISERKRFESDILRLNVELKERAAELEGTTQELEAFNYSVAHDLRQPINTVNLGCQTIEHLCGESLGEECAGYLQMIYRTTRRMDQLIEALLQFSKVGHAAPAREMVNLSFMAEEIAHGLQATEPERAAEILIVQGVTAHCDGHLLRVVLVNLLGNAWKHTRSKPKAVIEFAVQQIDDVATYLVRDNGEGFDMAVAADIFKPFWRGKKTAGSEGFGIGLATAERIILRHGGRIWAEGKPGQGATFFFTLQR